MGDIMELRLLENNTPKENFYFTDLDDVKDYENRMRGSRVKRHNAASFGAQKVELNHYLISPAGFEGIMYTLYFVLIPYSVGALFLFLFIAHVSFEKFLQLDLASLFIVWAIGYEMLAVLLLFFIFLSYLWG